MSIYRPLREINDLQTRIMRFVDEWVHTEKTPVPRKRIIQSLEKEGVKHYTTVNAINALVDKSYLRRVTTTSRQTVYVQLRGIL